MNAGKFTLILQLLSTILLINCVMSYDNENDNAKDVTTEWMNKAFVATTPAIKTRLVERSSEEEDDDDDDENDDVNHSATQSTIVPQLRQTQSYGGGNSMALMVVSALSNAIFKSVSTALKNHPPQFGRSSSSSSSSDEEEYYQENEQDSSSSSSSGRSIDTIINNDTKSEEVFEGRQQGAYIKGDPLNGYYDFVITEGSYKFWVVFQLFTAGLLIYSTLAAIYYSKVNPLTSDYDYIDYLSRSFHGRSMDSEDVEDDDDSSSSNSTDRTAIESGRTYLSSLAHNKWVRTAAYGFQFAMDAIDRIPQ